MIYNQLKEVVALYYRGKAIQQVYHAGRLVWEAIRSCFGSGGWFNEKPWLNDEGWKN